jgi:hypothetical protein
MNDKQNRRVRIVGKTLSGAVRTYELEKIPAIVGVRLIHEYGSVILANLDQIQGAFAEFLENRSDGNSRAGLLPLLELIPKVLTFPRLAGLAMDMLAGGSVDGEEIDADGMCPLFGEDPFELYTALFWALTVNYPKYLDPLLEALPSDDSIPDSKEE